MKKKKSAKKGKRSTPAKRRGNGVKLLNGGVDPAVGKATQIQPGQVLNPTGRPKTKPILSAIEDAITADPSLVKQIAKKALKQASDSLGWFTEVRDMLDGKPEGATEGGSGGSGSGVNLNLSVTFKDAEPKA